jgi:hypothetical protein
MMTNQLADLQNRLADAAAGDLSGIALDGLTLVWPPTDALPAFDPDLTASFDTALALIAKVLPGWSAGPDGTGVAGGKRTCRLRATGLRDDDELIGIGAAVTAPSP